MRPHHKLPVLLKIAGLARSTFYYQIKALEAGDKYAVVKSHIRKIYDRHKGRYGYRRVTDTLKQAGQLINHKTVQRLMTQFGLKSRVRPKKYRSYRGPRHVQMANLLQRKFKAERFGEKWVTDVTEFKVGGEKLYLSPVMDLYNGEIVSYQTSRSDGGQHAQEGHLDLEGDTSPHAALGSGMAISDARLPAHLGRKRHYAEYVAQRELPG
ncbi:IS3 family transposase [Herbaspirillum frisingense]|nr:IS3 family transposase [Herbaspirillum frisingense]